MTAGPYVRDSESGKARGIIEVNWTTGILSPSRNHSEQNPLRGDGRLLVL
jgi:hypothetical protein